MTKSGNIFVQPYQLVKKVIFLLDLLVFLLANFALYLIIMPQLEIKINIELLFLVIILTSLLILKTDILVKVIRRQTFYANKNISDFRPNFRIFSLFFVILPRFLFFGSLYYLFPLLLVWLAVIGILLYLDFVAIIDTAQFIRLITLLSILFALFQYYLKRYEEKIQNVARTKLIELLKVVDDSISFDEFLEYLEEKDEDLFNLINENQKDEGFKKILEIFKVAKFPGKSVYQIYAPIFLTSQHTNLGEFLYFEDELEGENKSKLLKYYNEYFNKVLKECLLNNLRNRETLNELLNLSLTNLVFIPEIEFDIITVFAESEKNKTTGIILDHIKDILNDLV